MLGIQWVNIQSVEEMIVRISNRMWTVTSDEMAYFYIGPNMFNLFLSEYSQEPDH